MADVVESGRRPAVVSADAMEKESSAISVCPGIALAHDVDRGDEGLIRDLLDGWGPVYGVWEGHAAESAVRFAGSSGGIATALSLFCIERRGAHGVLHTAARADAPYLNESVLSRTRDELVARTGSRYAPASPCEALDLVEQAPGKCVFVGKPCDVAALHKTRKLKPILSGKIEATIAFFCAGVPSTRGTLDLLTKVGVSDPSRVLSLRYRGNGWPGRWVVRFLKDDGAVDEKSLSYDESWGFLQKYRQPRCYLCPDHTGEFADVAVGDPWYQAPAEGEEGRSVIVARTRTGLRLVKEAALAGYISLVREDPTLLPRAQPNLLRARGRLWGQLFALKLIAQRRPVYSGFELWRYWVSELSVSEKVKSVVGTLRRRLQGRRMR